MWLCPVIIASVFICALFTLGALIYRNKPIIKEVNGDVLLKFARFTTENLPKNGAILLADSDMPGQDQPLRALLIQAAIAYEGRTRDFSSARHPIPQLGAVSPVHPRTLSNNIPADRKTD